MWVGVGVGVFIISLLGHIVLLQFIARVLRPVGVAWWV